MNPTVAIIRRATKTTNIKQFVSDVLKMEYNTFTYRLNNLTFELVDILRMIESTGLTFNELFPKGCNLNLTIDDLSTLIAKTGLTFEQLFGTSKIKFAVEPAKVGVKKKIESDLLPIAPETEQTSQPVNDESLEESIEDAKPALENEFFNAFANGKPSPGTEERRRKRLREGLYRQRLIERGFDPNNKEQIPPGVDEVVPMDEFEIWLKEYDSKILEKGKKFLEESARGEHAGPIVVTKAPPQTKEPEESMPFIDIDAYGPNSESSDSPITEDPKIPWKPVLPPKK